jgi:hypothetical protein
VRVDGAIARDDEVEAGRVEADLAEDERRSRHELGAERRERRPRGHQLAEAATRGDPRVEPRRVERDRLRRLDDRAPVVELEPARPSRPAEGVVHVLLVPHARAGARENVERPLTAVRDRQLLDLDALHLPQPRRERGRRVDRR